MGHAAYERGSAAIVRQIRATLPERATEFCLMERLNALPKIAATRPWIKAYPPDGAYAEFDGSRWWLFSARGPSAFGYCYPTLETLIANWDADIVAYERGKWFLRATIAKESRP